MKLVNGIFLIIAIVLSALVFNKDPALLYLVGKNTIVSIIEFLPILIIAFFITELLQCLISQEKIINWIGNKSGWRGIWAGYLIGILSPNGPMVMFPIMAGMQQAGAGIATLVAVATTWCTCSIRIILLEMAIISPRFALFKLSVCFFIPFLSAGLAHYLLARYWKR